MTTPLLILDSGPGEPEWNMAFDEALLVTASRRSLPILRFYAWTLPAATFGYSQRFADVAAQTLLRPLVRRPTGGGLVPHDRDWTYSLTVPPGQPWYRLSACESYQSVHRWIQSACASLGLTADLAPTCRKEAPGQCFVGHDQYDLLWQGRKIAGAAQRRNRLGLLIQGSVQAPPGLERGAWQAAMADAAPKAFFLGTSPADHDPDTDTLARSLVESKYAQAAYNTGR